MLQNLFLKLKALIAKPSSVISRWDGHPQTSGLNSTWGTQGCSSGHLPCLITLLTWPLKESGEERTRLTKERNSWLEAWRLFVFTMRFFFFKNWHDLLPLLLEILKKVNSCHNFQTSDVAVPWNTWEYTGKVQWKFELKNNTFTYFVVLYYLVKIFQNISYKVQETDFIILI